MSKWLKVLLVFVAYYGHARYQFSEAHLQKWVVDFNAKAMSGDQTACEVFSDDAEVNIYAPNHQGHWEIEGGKDEACGYLHQAAAAMTLLQAQSRTNYDDFVIEMDGFPWLKATISYTEHTTISSKMLPSFSSVSQDSLVVGRTLSGLKIKKLDSQGEMESPDGNI